MAHLQQIDFCKSVRGKFPHYFSNKLVLDLGSLDINGNNHYLFDDCLYLGVDLLPGKNVDLATTGHELSFPDESVDTIISTECFEHDQYYQMTLKNIVRMLKPGGLLLFTCATTGRPEHGTRRTMPSDAPFIQEFGEWADYYKNLEETDIRSVLDVDALFEHISFSTNMETYDLYFWGIKKGTLINRYDYSFQIYKSELSSVLETRNETICELENQIVELNQAREDAIRDFENQIVELNQAREETICDLENQIGDLNQSVNERDSLISSLFSSYSWRLTRPLRFFGQVINGDPGRLLLTLSKKCVEKIVSIAGRALNVYRFIIRGDFDGLFRQIRVCMQDASLANIQAAIAKPISQTCWGIMATKHTLFIAHIISERLQGHGWKVEILTESPADFHHDWYIVICPQMFNKIPPGEKRISYQMEQSVSSRWFTERYFKTLDHSLAVLEYSLVNVGFMSNKGVAFPHVHYLPVGASVEYGEATNSPEKTCDILFYGDSNSSPRRREMLDVLKQHFNVQIASEVYGYEMQKLIKQSRLVINLHYYQNALLELPRIQECLSLGVPVVSESSQDQDDYPELKDAVLFFEQGSISAMLETVNRALNIPMSRERIDTSVGLSARRFEFMFDRFLVSMGFLPASHVNQMSIPLSIVYDRVALSMPETIERRRVFDSERPVDCAVFDGIRRRPGWVGCGLSYVALAQHALRHDKTNFTVMEDDVILPPEFEAKMATIQEFLDSRSAGKWDVFAGVIASLHSDAKIISVELFKGITFVTINKMTSTVFNVYTKKALSLLASWNPENLDAGCNTIDRFLESQTDLRVVVTLPFLVGHREEVHSTIWGFQNTQYIDWIANSEQTLSNMVLAHKDSCLTASN